MAERSGSQFYPLSARVVVAKAQEECCSGQGRQGNGR